MADHYNPDQRRDRKGKWSKGSSLAPTAVIAGAASAAESVLKAKEKGLFAVRSWDGFKTALKTKPPVHDAAEIAAKFGGKGSKVALAKIGAKGALSVVGPAIDAYEVGHNWGKDWGAVTFSVTALGLTAASLLAPPAAPALLGVGLALGVIAHNKRVNQEVGDFTAPGWTWIDDKVVQPVADLPGKVTDSKK